MEAQHRTLLLTAWYFPIKILRWEDAVKMKYEGLVDVVAEYDDTVSSPSITWNVPAVIRLRRATRTTKHGVKFSRINVYTRDNFTCQYCGHRFPMRALSYDHVTPRSAGGKTVWENIVTACKTCNSLKDDKTCDEAGMWPLQKPRRPRALPMTSPVIDVEDAPEEWKPFLGAATGPAGPA